MYLFIFDESFWMRHLVSYLYAHSANETDAIVTVTGAIVFWEHFLFSWRFWPSLQTDCTVFHKVQFTRHCKTLQWAQSYTDRNEAKIQDDVSVAGWFSDNFNFCFIICLYFGISNLKIYPLYTNSFKYIFPDLNTNNAQFGIFTSFWRLFCTNLRMKCHHRHTLVYAYK